jgi:L-asparaginase/Glu-tRNA(Gln) amidotransferase subunit D
MTVVVVSTGGTTGMRPDPATGKLVQAAFGEELVAMLDWLEAPPIELDDFASVPSFDVHGELCATLAKRVREHAGVRGHAARRLPVVVASRCVDGLVEPVYGRGGGTDLAEAGAIFAGPKARVPLQLAMAAGVAPAKALAEEAG